MNWETFYLVCFLAGLMLSFIYSLHRQPLAENENRPKSGSDSRPSDRRKMAGASTAA